MTTRGRPQLHHGTPAFDPCRGGAMLPPAIDIGCKRGDAMNINRTTLYGLIFAIGLVLGLLGYVGRFYSSAIATILVAGTWIIGYALVNLFFKPEK
ncbi:MAG: hypothetical protein IT535_14905 [Bauldia sp.]|nr:hypothetical protein [Bauldia sp.]